MMCVYCGSILNGEAIEITLDDNIVHVCDEECAIYYYQEMQQQHFRSWVKYR